MIKLIVLSLLLVSCGPNSGTIGISKAEAAKKQPKKEKTTQTMACEVVNTYIRLMECEDVSIEDEILKQCVTVENTLECVVKEEK